MMDLTGYAIVFRRWWLTVLLATLAAGASAYFVAGRLEPTFESTAQLLVGPVASRNIDDLRVAEQLTQTYAELVTSESVLNAVIRNVPLATTAVDLRESVSAHGDTATRVLSITVRLPDPELAAATATELAAALGTLTSSPSGSPGGVQVIGAAQVPERPVAPQVLLVSALAAAAGLVGALLCALLADYKRGLVRGMTDLESLTDAPVIATVPMPRRRTVSLTALDSMSQQTTTGSVYRRIAASLLTGPLERPRTLMIVGAEGDDRSPEVAFHIALAAARNGMSTTLIDADEAGRGVTALLERDGTALIAIRSRSAPYRLIRGQLEVMPYRVAGVASQPNEHGAALESVTHSGRVVVVSGGPVASSPTSTRWARRSDATVLVVVRNATRRAEIAEAVNALRLIGVELTGLLWAERGRA